MLERKKILETRQKQQQQAHVTTHSMTSASAGPTPFPNIENGFPTATSCVTTDSAPTAPMTTSENRNSLLTHYGGVTSSSEGRTATQVLNRIYLKKLSTMPSWWRSFSGRTSRDSIAEARSFRVETWTATVQSHHRQTQQRQRRASSQTKVLLHFETKVSVLKKLTSFNPFRTEPNHLQHHQERQPHTKQWQYLQSSRMCH